MATSVLAIHVAACSSSEPLPTTQGDGRSAARGASSECDDVSTDRPFRTSEHAAAFAASTGQMIVFGGNSAVAEACDFPSPRYHAETWAYDDACASWRRLPDGPSARGRHSAAYGDGMFWIFGGRYRVRDASGPYTLYDDLLRFDVERETWETVRVPGLVPAARVDAGMIYDESRGRLWVHGGNASTDGAVYAPLDDLWSYDVSVGAWEQHRPSGDAPEPRLQHAMAYDAARDRIVVFGGSDETAFALDARYFDSLWSLDLESMEWTRHAGRGAPEGRFWSRLVVDAARDEYLLFGGHDDAVLGNRNDTWVFDPNSDAWLRIAVGDVFNAEPTGACEFPPDFTVVAVDQPERRSNHALVWDSSSERPILFGGKTDCGVVDDVWTHDGASWSVRSRATEGEACHRWRDDPSACANLCN